MFLKFQKFLYDLCICHLVLMLMENYLKRYLSKKKFLEVQRMHSVLISVFELLICWWSGLRTGFKSGIFCRGCMSLDNFLIWLYPPGDMVFVDGLFLLLWALYGIFMFVIIILLVEIFGVNGLFGHLLNVNKAIYDFFFWEKKLKINS